MGKTWADIKNETLQKMFSYSNGGAVTTAGNEDYILAMPAVANYALRDLASVCRPIHRVYSLSHNPVPNMLGDTSVQWETVRSTGADISYTADDPKAFYYEVDGPCTVLLEQVTGDASLTIQTYENAVKGKFTAFSGLVPLAGTIRLRFLGGMTYNLRNVAFYASPFAAVEDIPPYTRYDRYNLRSLIGPTFMRLSPNAVMVTGQGQHRVANEYRWEPNDTLVIDHYTVGQYDIFYEAYPTEITEDTDDAFEPELAAEALDMVPLYMASQLYMDDDVGKATDWLNQYNARRAELSGDQDVHGSVEWTSESGWW
jgi:hypothetical protein